jgi:hypothetical protein
VHVSMCACVRIPGGVVAHNRKVEGSRLTYAPVEIWGQGPVGCGLDAEPPL